MGIRWVNDKKFDGGQSSPKEAALRDFYKRLLSFTINSEALMGAYREIHFYNKEITENYNHRVLSYVRWSENQKLIIVSNFDVNDHFSFDLKVPVDLVNLWKLKEGIYPLHDALYGHVNSLRIENGEGHISINLNPLESFIFELKS